jgi:hypothetical protein
MSKEVSPSFEKDQEGRNSRDEFGHTPDQKSGNQFDFTTTRARFWMALALSILFHMSLGGGLVLTPKQNFSKRISKTSVELMTPEEMKALGA